MNLMGTIILSIYMLSLVQLNICIDGLVSCTLLHGSFHYMKKMESIFRLTHVPLYPFSRYL